MILPPGDNGNADGGGFAGRGGVSPIGTTSPNSGSVGNTNSAYAPGAFTSGVNVQGSATAYTLQNTDYQGLILFNTSSPVAVTLNFALGENFTATSLNIGAGQITLTPNIPPQDSGSDLYTVNGAASLTLASKAGCIVAYAARLWYAYVGATFIPVSVSSFNGRSGVVVPEAGDYAAFYPEIVATVSLPDQTDDNMSGTILASAPAGLYECSVYFVCNSVAGGRPSTDLTITYTDDSGPQSFDCSTLPPNVGPLASAGQFVSGTFMIENAVAGDIGYAVSRSGIASLGWSLYIVLKWL
jgi:hypothetical protein